MGIVSKIVELFESRGQASGYASLDSGGKVPDTQIPDGVARDSEVIPRSAFTERGQLLYASGSGACSTLDLGQARRYLKSMGPGGTPVWSNSSNELHFGDGLFCAVSGIQASIYQKCYLAVEGSSLGLYVTDTPIAHQPQLLTMQVDADRHMRGSLPTSGRIYGRWSDTGNAYYIYWLSNLFRLTKLVAGAATQLATENLVLSGYPDFVLSISGQSLKGSRDGGSSFTITATDSSHAQGNWGYYLNTANYYMFPISFGSAMSPGLPLAGYFRAPVTGSGSEADPYRAAVPRAEEEEPSLGVVNRAGLNLSALIPSDDKGRPLHSEALVRVFLEANRAAHLWPLQRALAELKAMPGVAEVPRTAAQGLARGMDPRLREEQLNPEAGWEI